MSLTRSEQDAQLAELYARIPRIPACDGRCWTSCGPVDMSDRERQRIRAAGVRITPYQKARASLDRFWCDALTGDKRCAVYELRPLVCRLWGVVEGMPCVYGCVPEGGYLTDAEAYRMIAESLRIGGGRHPNASAGEIDAAMARGNCAPRLSASGNAARPGKRAARRKASRHRSARHGLRSKLPVRIPVRGGTRASVTGMGLPGPRTAAVPASASGSEGWSLPPRPDSGARLVTPGRALRPSDRGLERPGLHGMPWLCPGYLCEYLRGQGEDFRQGYPGKVLPGRREGIGGNVGCHEGKPTPGPASFPLSGAKSGHSGYRGLP